MQWRALAAILLLASGLAAQTPIVTPETLTFTAFPGGADPAPQVGGLNIAAGVSWSVTITNVAGPGEWLTVSPMSGSGPSRITFTARAGTLGVGELHQTVQISSAGGTALVNVFFNIRDPAPVLTLGSRGLQFTAAAGGANPPPQRLSITNTGTGALSWDATTTGESWLAVTPASGTAPGALAVSVNIAGLAAGEYSSRITVTAPGAVGSPASVPVTLQIGTPRAALTLSARSLVFAARQGCPSPAAQTVSVANGGGGTLNWTSAAATTSGGPWLAASPVVASGDGPLSVRPNTVGLAAGAYAGTVEVAAEGATGSPQSVAVRLEIAAPPVLSVTPASLTFSAAPGASPAAQTLALGGLSGCALPVSAVITAIAGGDWLTAAPAESGESALTVGVNSAAMAAGVYHATLAVIAPGAANSPQTVPVRLAVSPPGVPLLAPDPQALLFSAAAGSSPAPQTVQIANAGGGSLSFSAEAKTESGAWLAVNAAAASLTVTVNSAALAAGAYTGTITLAAAGAANSPLVIPVTLAVGAPVAGQNALVNGASFSMEAVVSPRSIASLFGSGLAAGTAAASSTPLPVTLGGAQVLVNGAAAPLFFVSPGQINLQIPADTTGSASVAVVSASVRGPAIQVRTAPEAPGIFSAQPGTAGQGAVLNQDFSANSADNPAAPGSVLQIFATGLGATNPPLATGQAGASAPPFHTTVVTPAVLINGASAEVLFSAAAPGFVGLNQVNVRIPFSTPAGGATLQLQVGGRRSNIVTFVVR
jgi:uncharacterized protein (TIGR03437 family)